MAVEKHMVIQHKRNKAIYGREQSATTARVMNITPTDVLAVTLHEMTEQRGLTECL